MSSAIGIFCISQYLIKKILDKILTDIKKLAPEEAMEVETRSVMLGYITKIVAILEYLFFLVLCVWLFRDNQLSDQEVGVFFKFFAGWLAIKMFPSYNLWSHVKVGKAYFYRSLFGTIILVTFAIFSGFIIIKAFFSI